MKGEPLYKTHKYNKLFIKLFINDSWTTYGPYKIYVDYVDVFTYE